MANSRISVIDNGILRRYFEVEEFHGNEHLYHLPINRVVGPKMGILIVTMVWRKTEREVSLKAAWTAAAGMEWKTHDPGDCNFISV